MKNITFLNKVSKKDISLVGGKAASLGELLNAGFQVPPGFVVTTNMYNKPGPANEKAILEAFKVLGAELVAVRSSAISEDSPTVSWAGQLESYLNITEDHLVKAVYKCWSSIRSDRANTYAKIQNIDQTSLDVAVIIQKMITSDVSGVMFTVNPVTGNTNEIMIEACNGLGESLVQGEITPDNYLINKKTFKSIRNSIAPLLDTNQLNTLSNLGKAIELHFGYPQDIEWTIANDKTYILQSRPITTIDQFQLL